MGATVRGGASGATSQLTVICFKSKEARMKKSVLVSFIVALTFAFSTMAMAAPKQPPTPPAPNGNVITACYQKINGQLRIVSDASKCRPSELAISWNMVGPQGPQGPSGVVATSTFGGAIAPISSGSTQWGFAGPTVNVTTIATQRITGAAQAPLGTLTAGTAAFSYDLCYRTAGTSDPLTNFTGTNASDGAVSDTAGRLSFAAAASVVPGAGTWEAGYCILNSGSVALDNNDFVNGWLIVTEQ